MWPFGREPSKDALLGLKKVRVNGGVYVIRRLNPVLDFTAANMPQVFATSVPRRKPDPNPDAGKVLKDMMAVVEAGVVKPELVPVGKGELEGREDGITVRDLFRDQTTGSQLYWEVLAHSMNRFRGLRGVFFSILLSYRFFTASRKNTVSAPATSPSDPVSSV